MTDIPKGFEGDIDPDDPNLKFRKQRWNYWNALNSVRHEWLTTLKDQTDPQFDAYDFEDFVEKKYGIKMNIVNHQITDQYKIVDEDLYAYFMLKWL